MDINNTVPKDMYEEDIKGKFDYTLQDTFMGFHCGNTCFQQAVLLRDEVPEDHGKKPSDRGDQRNLRGRYRTGRHHILSVCSQLPTAKLRAYVAQGEVLPVATKSFGSIGIFAIPEMGRFYRHVLIEKNYPTSWSRCFW